MSSLENGLRILALFKPGCSVLRVVEVSDALGIPKSSASRLMATLAEFGLLARSATDSGYLAGTMALSLYDSYLKGRPLAPEFELILSNLAQEFSFTALASTLKGVDLVLVSAKYGSHPMRIVQPIGQLIPAEETVAGKCLLARLDDDEVRRRFSEAGRTAPDTLFLQLQSIRRDGFLLEASRRTKGVETIGSAVVPSGGEGVGFGLIYPIQHGADIKDAAVGRVLEYAGNIGVRCGDAYWITPPPA